MVASLNCRLRIPRAFGVRHAANNERPLFTPSERGETQIVARIRAKYLLKKTQSASHPFRVFRRKPLLVSKKRNLADHSIDLSESEFLSPLKHSHSIYRLPNLGAKHDLCYTRLLTHGRLRTCVRVSSSST